MRRRPSRLVVAALAIGAAAAPGLAPAAARGTTRPELRHLHAVGPMWYSATLRVPSESWWRAELSFEQTDPSAQAQCFILAARSGESARYDDAGPWHWHGRTVTCSQSQRQPGVIRLLIFAAARGTIAKSSLVLDASPKVRVIAESWGRETRYFLREDFAAGTSASAGAHHPLGDPPVGWRGMGTGASADPRAGSSRVVRFDRRAVAFFSAFPGIVSVRGPGEGFVDGWLLCPCGNLRPAEALAAVPTGDDGYGVNGVGLAGEPPGRYVFTVEAAAEHQIRIDPQPDFRYVHLAVADADFPACTASPVRTRAGDGHPVCGDPL